MAVLKKIKGATLLETLVATVVILAVFLVSSLIINNVFRGLVSNKKEEFENRVREVSYFVVHDKLELPFLEENEKWRIHVERINRQFIITYSYGYENESKDILTQNVHY